jgi:hypothetical protein
MMSLPGAFDEYLAQFKRKRRYNLRRQLKRLVDHSGGTLQLRRIHTPDQVGCLRDAISVLLTGQKQRYGSSEAIMPPEAMVDLAERGLLLSYVLMAATGAYAMAFGTASVGMLQVHRFAHLPDLEHLSPGTTLQYLMAEDLINNRLARRVDYGFGEPKWPTPLDAVEERANIFLLRKSLLNSSTVFMHSNFYRVSSSVKKGLGLLSEAHLRERARGFADA